MSISAIHPFAIHDASQSLVSNQRWQMVWKVASIVTAIAFTAFAVLAIAFTSELYPFHLPVVSILLLAGGLPFSATYVTDFWKKSDRYGQDARIDQTLKNFISKTENPAAILKDLRIPSDADEPIKKTLLARYHLFLQQRDSLIEEARSPMPVEPKCVADVDFNATDEAENFDAVQIERKERQELLRQAAIFNLQAAYTLYLIQTPLETRPIDAFVTVSKQNYLQALIAEKANDPSAHLLIQVKGKHYTKEKLLNKDPVTLSQEIFGLKTHWRNLW